MARRLLLTSLGALALTGCGGNVVVDALSGTTTTTGTTTGSMSSTSTTGTTTSALPCPEDYISLTVDLDPEVQLTSICNGASWNPDHSTQPIGYLFEGGPYGLAVLTINGCASGAPGAQGLLLLVPGATVPGSYYTLNASYADGMGNDWSTTGGNSPVGVVAVGPVGTPISGNFTFPIAEPGGRQRSLHGSFSVCHVQDELAP
jgi:hypothetical protein